MGKAVSDEHYMDTLLVSLPATYDTTVSSISASAHLGLKTLTTEIFEQLVIDEYEHRQAKDKRKDTKDEALSADSDKKGGRAKGKAKRSTLECYNCGKKGHYKSECWEKGGSNEGGGPRQGKGAKEDVSQAEEQKDEPEAWAAIEVMDGPTIKAASSTTTAAAEHTPTYAAQSTSGRMCKLYNSRAMCHMSPYHKCFKTYHAIPLQAITAVDKRVFYAVRMGDLEIEVPNGTSPTLITLKDVLHAPDMGITIVSINRITKAGYSVTFNVDTCQIQDKSSKVIGTIPASQNGLYKVEKVYATTTREEHVNLRSLHQCLAHISPNTIHSMINNGSITGIELVDDGPTLICEACEQAKMTRKQIQKEHKAPLASVFGGEMHTNLWEPALMVSLGGRQYYISFTDNHSQFTMLTILRTKSQTFDAYKAFAAWAKTQHGAKIKCLCSDRSGEYLGKAFSNFLRERGTKHWLTTHDTPQHNGVTEALNCHIMEHMHTFLIQSGLPKSLWAEAAQFVVWLKNCSPTRAIGNITPYKRLTGQKPSLAGVPKWGQRVWVYNDSGTKLDKHATEARWVGYDTDSTHAHHIYWPDAHKVSVERNIKFTADSVIVSLPQPRQHASAIAQMPAPAQMGPQPPPATDSGEDEVEVEDKLDERPLGVMPATPHAAPH